MELLWLLIPIGLICWYFSRLGTFYIEFDGDNYYVWERAFLGYNNLKGRFPTEQRAREKITALQKNPPRIIP